MKPTILAFVQYYLPGYKSGGPIRTIANLVDHLGEDFDFRIVTSDRDAMDDTPYPDVSIDNWNRVGKAQVYYVSPTNRTLRKLVELITNTSHDVLYLNSFFDSTFTVRPLLARRFGLIPKRPVVIASRGEFSLGALAIKRWKKRPFMALARAINLYGGLTWQASSEHEAHDIVRVMGNAAKRVVVATDLPPIYDLKAGAEITGRREGPLRVVFLSRISPMKNLEFALNVLSKVQVPLQFNIYGPIRDEPYWQKCQALMADMPKNISISYKGSVENSEVPAIMSSHDLFFLPTRGENFGHVILEALSAATPVLIADTTPWRNLEEMGVGWDLPLCDENRYVECIHHAASLTPESYADWRKRVRAYALERAIDPVNIDNNRKLFIDAALQSGKRIS